MGTLHRTVSHRCYIEKSVTDQHRRSLMDLLVSVPFSTEYPACEMMSCISISKPAALMPSASCSKLDMICLFQFSIPDRTQALNFQPVLLFASI